MAARQLQKAGKKFTVLEARDRLAGRIHTLDGPLEMGATWFGSQHMYLRQLISELGIDFFEQYSQGQIVYDGHELAPIQYIDMPAGQPPSYRIKGGTHSLIKRLSEEIDQSRIQLNTTITQITDRGDHLEITDRQGNRHKAHHVLLTLPPQLAASTITFSPGLPQAVQNLWLQTHTWMGESIKFGLTYSTPFWKAKGLSGAGFAQTGPIEEVHDHSQEEGFFALKGFLRPQLASLTKAEREAMVSQQLQKMFGPEAAKYLAYEDRPWLQQKYTSVAGLPGLVPHQNNGHPQLSEAQMNGKLLLAGTESSPVYGGYMDGAVYAGTQQALKVINALATAYSS